MTNRHDQAQERKASEPEERAVPPAEQKAVPATDEETRETSQPMPSPEELQALRKKAAEYDDLMDRLKRVTADYLNSQKRLEREMRERCNYAIESFAREILAVADDLARAIAAAREHETVETILEGLELVEKHLYAVLERYGVRPVKTEPGGIFDPEVHEAVSMLETDQHEPNRVLEELQRGFHIHGRLLRPARVVVTGQPEETVSQEELERRKQESQGSER